jgi:hypothetical protein
MLVVAGVLTLRSVRTTAPERAPASTRATLARIDVAPLDVRLSADRALATRGSGGTPFLEEFGRAIAPYRDGRFAEAATLLGALAAKFPDAYEPPLYHGVALLLAGDHSAAIAPLDRAAGLGPASIQDEVRWYRAAALQRAGNSSEVLRVLRTLCDGAGPFRDRACAIVNSASP